MVNKLSYKAMKTKIMFFGIMIVLILALSNAYGKEVYHVRIDEFNYDEENNYCVIIYAYVKSIPSKLFMERTYQGLIGGVVKAFRSCYVFGNFELQQGEILYSPNQFLGEIRLASNSPSHFGTLRPGAVIYFWILVPENLDVTKPIKFWVGDKSAEIIINKLGKKVQKKTETEIEEEQLKALKIIEAKRNAYFDAITARIQANWSLLKNQMENVGILTTDIGLHIQRDGTVMQIVIEKPSGNELFDKYAVRAVKRSIPLPPFPEDLKEDRLEVTIGLRS